MSSKQPRGAREEDLAVKTRKKTRRPPQYKVIIHNDDFTTMDFVVLIVMEVFNRSRTEATHLMLQVHMKGRGVCGEYTRDVAETKVARVSDLSRENGHPLLCTMEPAD